ncbi:LysM peptidoglycan-binding domain-containing protein [Streptomyces sp. CRN 30]|uniref:CIS tube protein n=1 Tax=Streptomyces sp. CRN 30 TaxID=3075613 RepID=UPI002A7F13F5|nr:LysM peptidoglycan-binding domain-containing protein [Streptomyces sp. CRN 30]
MAKSSGAGKSLVHATLAIHEPPTGDSPSPGGLIKNFSFQFNPAQLSLSRQARWQDSDSAATRNGPVPEFMGAVPRELSLEIFLDTSDKPDDNKVLKQVESLMKCCVVTDASLAADKPSPPWVIFQWGSFSTARFVSYVSSVEASYTLFSTSGTPIRAACQLRLHELPHATQGQNPTSGALTAQRVHRVVAGDSLQSLAWQEYGDASAWRAIAEANEIDNPGQLPTGTDLLLPATSEVRR